MRILHRVVVVASLLLAGVSCADAPEDATSEADQTAERVDARIAASSGYGSIGDAARSKVDAIARAVGPLGRSHLADVLERNPERLLATDRASRTTLDNLVDMLGARHPAIEREEGPFAAAALREAVLGDVAHPERIHQGPFNTCQITVLQNALADRDPSEYVRIASGLTGPTGKVTLRGGRVLELYTRYLSPDPEDTRSASEAIFQSSVMDEVTGSYDARKDVNEFLFWTYPGNSTGRARATVEALFGRGFVHEGLNDLQIVLSPRGVMRKDDALSFLRRVTIADAPAIVDLVLDGMGTSHSVLIVRVDGDRVIFRNPWGPQSISQSSGRLEDGDRSLYSMALDEMAGRMQAYLAPR